MADHSDALVFEMQEGVSKITEQPSTVPPCHSPVLAKPVISLHQAARDGSEDVVQKLMGQDNSVVDAYDSEGYTAFHYAAQHHNLSMMKLLVAVCTLRLCTSNSYNALQLAAGAESKYKPGEQNTQAVKDTMQFLVDKGLDINVKRGGFKKSVLYFAWSSGNKAAVEFLLDQKNQFNGNSVLHDACTTSNVELLKLLLEELKKRCQLSDMLTANNYQHQTPLHVALGGHHIAMANKLLEFASNDEYAGVRFDPHLVLHYSQGRESDAVVEFLEIMVQNVSIDSNGVTILHLVAERGWVKAAKAIAVKKASLLNKKDNHGRTPLHYAAAKNNCEIVDFLMEQKCIRVDAPDKDGWTPLELTAREGCTEAFAKLLEKADVGRVDNQLMIVVLLAVEAGHSAILEVVKAKYPDVLKQFERGDTPLHVAAAIGSEKSVKVLLDWCVDVNARNEDKQTPLHLAASNGHNGVVKMLLVYEPPSVQTDKQLATVVDISAKDDHSNTALHLAAGRGHCSVAVTLLSRRESVSANCKNKSSETPLHLAAGRGHQEMVELLISKHHAVVDAEDKWQHTPFYLAVRNGHSDDVVTTLLKEGANVAVVDTSVRNALAIAIENEDDAVAMAILKHGVLKLAMSHTFELWEKEAGQQTTPMRELIKKMPEVAMLALNKSTVKGREPRSDDCTVKYDYELLEDLGKPEDAGSNTSVSPRRCGWYHRPSQLFQRLTSRSKREGLYSDWGPSGFDVASHPLMLMVKHKRTEMLNHPLVSSLIAYKWKRALPLYLANVLFYLMFLIFFTAYALVLPNPQSELCLSVSNPTFANASVECGNGSNDTAILCGVCSSNQPFLYAAGAIVLLCVLVRVIMELIQFLEQPGHYFLNHENWLELFLYSLTLIFMSSLGGTCVCPKPWQWQIGALAVFLAWIHLSIFVKKLPLFGLYIIMFEGIVITFVKIAIPALLLVLAFSMAFYMMFFVPGPLFAASPFATPGLSIIKAMTMAVGEMEFESIFRLTSGGVFDIDEVPTPIPYTGVSILLWIFFLILMPILLMNLLTGLAVGDVDRIQSDAEFKKIELQINLVLKIEEAFQAFHTWFIPPRKTISCKPNKHRLRKRFLSLLTGVDKYRTGEDIHNSLSKPVKHIEIGHVHEQITTLLAKQQEVAKLSSEQRKEIAELKKEMCEQLETAMAKQRTEISMKMSDKLKITMAQQRIEISMKMNDQLETAMATQRILQREEMAEQKEEMAAMRAAMDEQTDMMKELLKLRGAEGREEEGRASPAQS